MSKIESNRKNAKLSTGPRTPEGRTISSKNSIKHGLTSKDVVLASESLTDYQDFHEAMFDSLRPFSKLEETLVIRIVQCAWRLQRMVRTEADLFNRGVTDAEENAIMRSIGRFNGPKETGIGDVFSTLERDSTAFSNLAKYEAACERSMYRALNTLERIQAKRLGHPTIAPLAIDLQMTTDESLNVCPVQD
jgi:hypothetical protein